MLICFGPLVMKLSVYTGLSNDMHNALDLVDWKKKRNNKLAFWILHFVHWNDIWDARQSAQLFASVEEIGRLDGPILLPSYFLSESVNKLERTSLGERRHATAIINRRFKSILKVKIRSILFEFASRSTQISLFRHNEWNKTKFFK